jgi:hypothetical protein
LGALKKEDFVNAKGFNTVIPSVEHVFVSCLWIVAGHFPGVEVDKKKKPKQASWKGC